MIDFGKLYCDHHPGEIITNFCLKQNCLISLCATCICTHTQQHMQSRTNPEYQNIRDTYSSMHETIHTHINSIENTKNRINKILQFVQSKRRTVKKNIQQVKKQILEALNQFFKEKENKMIKQIEIKEKRVGLHSQLRMNSLMSILNRQVSTLINAAQQLNSQNFLDSYKRIKQQTLKNTIKVQCEVSDQLQKNQSFDTVININNGYLHEIIKSLDSSLQILFKINSIKQDSHSYKYNLFETQKRQNFQDQSLRKSMRQSQGLVKNDSRKELGLKNVEQTVQKRIEQHQSIQKKQSTSKSIPIYEQDRIVELAQNNTKRLSYQINQFLQVRNKNSLANFHTPVWQSHILKQKDFNQQHQPQNNIKVQNLKNNSQSHLIIGERKMERLIYQNANSNICYHPNANKTDFNVYEPVQMNVNFESLNNTRQVASKNQIKFKNPVVDNSSHPKFSYIPQKAQFLKENANILYNTSMNMDDCKKVSKSGLSLLKTYQNTVFSSKRLGM